MGISSHLLLNLDANFKLHQAKKNAKDSEPNHQSDKFLKRYDWVSA
jgi:antitoxin HigA-1